MASTSPVCHNMNKNDIDDLWEYLPGDKEINILFINEQVLKTLKEVNILSKKKLSYFEEDNNEMQKNISIIKRILGDE